ncbi:MAG: glycine--tRNA ligase [Spirochaetia bacterium]|nr:glycine--tRNA ligase [Spirochaetia bacterium]
MKEKDDPKANKNQQGGGQKPEPGKGPAPAKKGGDHKAQDPLKEIVALAKRRGFVYPGSDIYGGLSNTFDYGPYGTELLRNLKDEWWKTFVHRRADIVGLDSSIILHPEVWVASGHVGSFNDPLVDCKNCRARYRADHILEEYADKAGVDVGKVSDLASVIKVFQEHGAGIACPSCGKSGTLTEPRQFNLMFQTKVGSVSGSDMDVYLRPETAQGIFINFKNIADTCRVKVPFGVAQIGKSFRNEIVARQFVFRTREFEQLELEFFCKPGTQKEWFEHWVEFCTNWLAAIGLKRDNFRLRRHDKDELSFYSDDTVDIEYKYPFGWGELWGIASRTNYDLTQHAKHAKKNLDWTDPESNEKYIPYVVEPALGLNRLMLAVLCDAYDVEDEGTPEQRVVLRLHPRLAPVKAGIFPLQKKDGLPEIARQVYDLLSPLFPVDYDASGNIGKRYYRQDELGTPFCITVDYESKENQTVTVRERDSKAQERVKIDDLLGHIAKKLSG